MIFTFVGKTKMVCSNCHKKIHVGRLFLKDGTNAIQISLDEFKIIMSEFKIGNNLIGKVNQ